MPRLVAQILAGQQDLGHGVVVLRKQFVIDVHQLALTDRSGGLLCGHVLRPACQVQLADTHADGAGGDEDDLVPGVFRVAEHLAEGLHVADIQMPRGVRQR